MAKTRQQKETEVNEIVQGLKDAKSVIFADISPLKVSEATELRHAAREEGVAVRSVKKTLFQLACKEAGLECGQESLSGSVTLLFGNEDEVAPAKLIAELSKKNKSVNMQGGLLESKTLTAAEAVALASIPSKQELIAQVVGSVRAPLSGLVGALQGNIRNLVYVLNAVKESK